MEWEKGQITLETEDEQEGKEVNLGIEGLNSNGHGKEKDKEGHIMKIIEGLQREAKARRVDSRKLMKFRDRQGELNLKFLKSLERIEKKLEKGRDSSTTKSRRTHGRRSRSRSGSSSDISVAPKDILTGRHTVVQACPLPENIEHLERRN
jgi:hypothetical protein